MRARTIATFFACAVIGAAAPPAEAGCTRTILNRTSHLVVVSQDGGPGFSVRPRRSHAVRYRTSGTLEVAVYCRVPSSRAGPPLEGPAFQATYATVAMLDRCYVDIDGGGTRPLALNAPRQGDVVVAPYGLACPAVR